LINPGQNILIFSETTFDNTGKVHRRKQPHSCLGTARCSSIVFQ
jgi:hypothetical protein